MCNELRSELTDIHCVEYLLGGLCEGERYLHFWEGGVGFLKKELYKKNCETRIG